MAYSAGTAFLTVVPSFRSIQRVLGEVAEQIGRRIDRAVGDSVPGAVRDGGRRARRAAQDAGDETGRHFGGSFANQWRRRLENAYRSFPELEPNVNTRQIDRDMDHIREYLKVLAETDITPDFDEREAIRDIRRIRAELRRMEADATDRRDLFNIRQARAEVDALSDLVRDARRRGALAGGAYAQEAERTVRRALQNLPEVTLDADSTPLDRRLAQARRELASLASQRIGLDLDDATFRRRLEAAERELDEIGRSSPTVQLRADAEQARDVIRRFLNQATRDADRSGERASGAFAEAYNRGLTRALRNLPDIEPNVNMNRAQARLQALRAQLAALDNENIDVNLNSDVAVARLRLIQSQLAWLSLNEPDITVRTNAARAAAELMAIIQLAQRADNIDPDIHVDTDRGIAGLRQLGASMDIPIHRLGVLVALGASIGPILVPAAAAAAVAIGGIATAALGAVAGIGVLALGLFGVFNAVKALDKYQKDADKSAKSLASSQTQIANAADSVRSAERSLANTRASVEAANRRAARAVADAQESVTDAVRDRQRAEEDLVEAIKAAQRADEDRRRSIRGNALDIRQANLDIAEAKQELDKVLANPRASEAEREQARITYEQRVLQLEELQAQQKDLAEEQAKWNREGVNGSDQVKSAQERLRAATDKVADAQERVAEAIESQQETHRQGQHQLETATQSLVQAQRSLQQATVNAGVAGGAALDNLREAMDALSPAGQRFAQFIFGLKDEFRTLRYAAQESLLPGLEAGIRGLLRYLPAITNFVSRMGREVGDSFAWAVEQMQNPEWQRFFRHISQTAIPAWRGLMRFTEAFSRGIASLIVSLSAFNGSMGRGLIEWAEGFAEWAEKLDESRGFQRFLAYVKEAGPDVVHFLGQLFELAKRLIIAWAPVGDTMLKVLTAIVKGINAIPLPALSFLLYLIAGISAAMLVFKGVGVIFRAVTSTIAAGAGVVVGSFRNIRTLFTGTTTSARAMNRALGSAMAGTIPPATAMNRAMASLHNAVVRVGTGAAAAARPVASFFGGLPTATRVAALMAGVGALNAYRTAIGRIAPVVAPALSAVQRLYGAFQSTAAATAGRAQVALNTLWGNARTVAGNAATQVGRYATAIRSMGFIGTGVATIQRGLTTAVVNTRTAMASGMSTLTRWATQLGVTSTAAGAAQRATALFNRALGGVRPVVTTAVTGMTGFVRAVGTTATTAIAGTTRALGGLMGALGGPWGLALTAATIGLTYFSIKSAEQRAKNVALRDSLLDLVDAYRSTDGSSEQAINAMIAQNSALRNLIVHSKQYGLAVSDVISAVEGEDEARNKVLSTYDREIDRLKALRQEALYGANEREAYRKAGVKDNAELDRKIAGLENERKAIAASTAAAVERAQAEEIVRKANIDTGNSFATVRLALEEADLTAGAYEDALSGLAEMSATAADKASVLALMAGRVSEANLTAADKTELFEEVLDQLGAAAQIGDRTFEALAETFGVVGRSSIDTKDKVDLLRRTLDQLYGATQQQVDADLDLQFSQRELEDQMRSNTAGFDLNSKAAIGNTGAVRDNIDKLREVLKALQEKYIQDIANGKSIQQATTDFYNNRQAIIDTIPKVDQNSKSVQDLTKAYGQVPDVKTTQVTTPGLDKALADLIDAHAIQLGLAQSPPWSKETIASHARQLRAIMAGQKNSSGAFKAEGGEIEGFSPTPTSDNIPIWATAGEFMQPVSTVDYYGVGVMEAMRQRRIPRQALRGYAAGGQITRWPISVPPTLNP